MDIYKSVNINYFMNRSITANPREMILPGNGFLTESRKFKQY